MEYKITEKPELKLIGIKKAFNSTNSNEGIPKFWDEIMKTADWANGLIKGLYGLCYEENGDNFLYMIADDYDPQKKVPKHYEIITLPKCLYAIFPCKGKIPDAIQDTNTKIFSDWLPNCKDYKKKENYTLEVYLENDYTEIWIPIEKI